MWEATCNLADSLLGPTASVWRHRPTTALALGLFGVVAVTVAVAELLHASTASPLLPTGSLGQRLLLYGLLAGASAGVVLYDLSQLGPTSALWHAAVAAAVAWVFAVPLGLFAEAIVAGFFFVTICSLGAVTALAMYQLEAPWNLGGLVFLAGSFYLATQGALVGTLTHVFGAVVVFLGTYFLVRAVISVCSRRWSPISSWEGLQELRNGDAEFDRVVDEFELACVRHNDKYNYWLKVGALHKVTTAKTLQRSEGGRALCHGTARENAQAILADGFRLPIKAGMFGKGIYFADCPMKSWNYTDGMPWRAGVILLCWVELGKAKHAKAANASLTKPPRRTFFQWLKGDRKYESVVGDDVTAGGALRVPEYIVYDPGRVEVDYVLEVWKTTPGAQ